MPATLQQKLEQEHADRCVNITFSFNNTLYVFGKKTTLKVLQEEFLLDM